MGHVGILYRLHVLDAHQVAYDARIDNVAQCNEIGCIAQYMAYGDDASVTLRLCEDVAALLLGLCRRLLEQNMIAGRDCLHARFVVKVVRCSDDHRIGKLRTLEHLAEITEAVLLRNAVTLGDKIAAIYIYIGYANHLHRIRETGRISRIGTSAAPGPDDYHGYGRRDIGLQRTDRHIYLLISCGRVRRLSGGTGRCTLPGSHCFGIHADERCPDGNYSEPFKKFLSVHSNKG